VEKLSLEGTHMLNVITLDLEGVLVPEIWINFAKLTKIDELLLTTRDIPDYDVLMQKRLDILKEHNLKIGRYQNGDRQNESYGRSERISGFFERKDPGCDPF
jgi:hypothetical protein